MRIPVLAFSLVLGLMSLGCGPSHDTSEETSGLSGSRSSLLPERAIEALALEQNFPVHPDTSLTPGLRCQDPDSQRYPERIDYCERDVSTSLKNSVIRSYDESLGFEVSELDREAFKIDHYIPLCMGGDNDRKNLWPQHKLVYEHTDLLEMQLCLALERGLLTQDETIDEIITAKNHLDEAATILARVRELLD